jgi:RNase P/RNase MRP subunit p30
VICADDATRIQKLVRTRILVRNALAAKVRICLVSLADKKEGILSSMQMLEVANFLGIDQKRSKEALSALGGLL